MSFTIRVTYEFSGADLYVVLFNSEGQAFDGSSFTSFDGDHTKFGLDMTEDVNAVRLYTLSLDDNIEPGSYEYEIWKQEGGSKSRVADTRVAVEPYYWVGGRQHPFHFLAIGARAGSIRWQHTEKDQHGNAIANVHITVCEDSGGLRPVAHQTTNSEGEAVFYLNKQTYYFFKFKPGFDFEENPQLVQVKEIA